MTTKYIYIDDQPSVATEPYARGIETHDSELTIEHQQPVEFSDQLRNLRGQKYSGLILDLRLDESKNHIGNRTEYRATALAQELRTRATENRIIDTPIALLSTNTKFKASFERDDTSHDLFDAVYTKESVPDNGFSISQELISLAKGYEHISKQKGSNRDFIFGLLDLNSHDIQFMDPRLASEFEGQRKRLPVHEYARFILRCILKRPGPLIDEAILAARLGIDITNSSDWNELKDNIFGECSYKGVFSEAWPRWWMFKILEKWQKLTRSDALLRSMNAQERVELLTKHTKLGKLSPAQPIYNGYSTKYWTICKGFHLPLDPMDGFLTAGPDPEAWQDKSYMSIKAALERVGHNNGLKVHALERDRLSELKGS